MLLACNKEAERPVSDVRPEVQNLSGHYKGVRSQLRRAFVTADTQRGTGLRSNSRDQQGVEEASAVDTLTIEEILRETKHSKEYQELMLEILSFVDEGRPLPTPEAISLMPFSMEEKYTLVTAQAIVREVSDAIASNLIDGEEELRVDRGHSRDPQAVEAPAQIDCDKIKSETRKKKIYRRASNIGVATISAGAGAAATAGTVGLLGGGPTAGAIGAGLGAISGAVGGLVGSTICNVYEYIVDDMEEIDRAYRDCINKGPTQKTIDTPNVGVIAVAEGGVAPSATAERQAP